MDEERGRQAARVTRRQLLRYTSGASAAALAALLAIVARFTVVSIHLRPNIVQCRTERTLRAAASRTTMPRRTAYRHDCS